jgi:hypothetical protein
LPNNSRRDQENSGTKDRGRGLRRIVCFPHPRLTGIHLLEVKGEHIETDAASPWKTTMDISHPTTISEMGHAPHSGCDRAGPLGPPAEMVEESLIADARAGLTPAQMVERKLVSLLRTNALLMSQVMAGSRTFRR